MPTFPKFTETEERVLRVLDDGLPHHPQELVEAIDTQADKNTLSVHLVSIRKKLRPVGHDVLTEYIHHKAFYRHVMLICSSDE